MDALTDIIRLLRPESVLLGAMAAAGRWGTQVQPQPGPTFYFVTQGRCWFQADDLEPVEMLEGDYMLSARPETDRFMSEPGVEAVHSDEAFKQRHLVNGEIRIGDPESEPTTRISGGLIVCDPANADLLVDLLPRYVHLRGAEDAGARLRTLILMVREEAESARPGRDAVLCRLIEVMLIETLRRESDRPLPQTGVLGALADAKLARALTDIHEDVGRSWTVGELARRAGMSRSAFARRFSEVVGAAPVEYLLGWRMALAKDALLGGRSTLEEIASAVGYQSASAFSTAFSRRVGCPPSEYAAATLRSAGTAGG